MVKHINIRFFVLLLEGVIILTVIGFIFLNRLKILNYDCLAKMGNDYQRLCLQNRIKVKDNLPEIKSGDSLRLAINLKSILNSKLATQNRVTKETITNVNLKDGQICIVIYPVLTHAYMVKDDQKTYDDFYKNYKWSVSPSSSLQLATRNTNSICTKRGDLTKLDTIFLDLDIPAKQYLFLAKLDTWDYGTKLVFVPNNLLGQINTAKDIDAHYNQMIPFYMNTNYINIGL